MCVSVNEMLLYISIGINHTHNLFRYQSTQQIRNPSVFVQSNALVEFRLMCLYLDCWLCTIMSIRLVNECGFRCDKDEVLSFVVRAVD